MDLFFDLPQPLLTRDGSCVTVRVASCSSGHPHYAAAGPAPGQELGLGTRFLVPNFLLGT